jgi:uncharacterized protein
VSGPPDAPRFLLLHGLEGGVRSHYARGMLAAAAQRGWDSTLLVFRSCGPELNRLPRFYHSGETGDVKLAIERVTEHAARVPLFIAGVSLGGNVLLRLLGEGGSPLAGTVSAAAAISVPFDLARSARHIQHGFARVYQRHFVRSLRRKALAKLARHEGIYDGGAVTAARTLYEFDNVVTAPLHGFSGAEDYYARASSLPVLGDIRVPTLLVSAVNDPFLPQDVLGKVRVAAENNRFLELHIVPSGGHVGFVSGPPWRQRYWAEIQAFEFFEKWRAQPGSAARLQITTGGVG